MRKILAGMLVIFMCVSCSRQQYVVTGIHAVRYPVKMNKNLEQDSEMHRLVTHYKNLLDKEMNQVIGRSTQDMLYDRPESLLTNLTSDVMLEYAKAVTGGHCDLSFTNVHGHRANLPKGDIKVGNIYEIYSFENALVIVKLKGDVLLKAFDNYAKMKGAGISGNVKLVIKDRQLVSSEVDGKPVDVNKTYNVVTLDYLAEGNDGMDALKGAIEVEPLGITLRDAMLGYVIAQTKEGKEISSQLDGRIIVE